MHIGMSSGQYGGRKYSRNFCPNCSSHARVWRLEWIVPFDVLARRRQPPLRAGQHPVQADPRVQVHVRLILPHRRLGRRQRVDEAPNRRDPHPPGLFAPRAPRHHRLGPAAAADLEALEQPPRRRQAHRHAGVRFGRLDQQAAGPGRPAVEELPRGVDCRTHATTAAYRSSAFIAVVLAAVDQSRFAVAPPAVSVRLTVEGAQPKALPIRLPLQPWAVSSTMRQRFRVSASLHRLAVRSSLARVRG